MRSVVSTDADKLMYKPFLSILFPPPFFGPFEFPFLDHDLALALTQGAMNQMVSLLIGLCPGRMRFPLAEHGREIKSKSMIKVRFEKSGASEGESPSSRSGIAARVQK